MKKLLISLFILASYILTGCGGGNTSGQSIPIGGTNFIGTLTPGVGNLQNNVPQTTSTCNAMNAQSENIQFQAQESGTQFYDPNSPAYLQVPPLSIFAGIFSNPVNQSNPCLVANINYSQCGNAQSGTIKFNACNVYLNGNHYQFSAVYYLYTSGGQLIQTGNIAASK